MICRLALLAASAIAVPAQAETPEEWITLGARMHGGFGAYIPVGVRIGLDALQRLDAKPRDVTVLYYDSDKAVLPTGLRSRPSRHSGPARCGLRRTKRRTGRWRLSSCATKRLAKR